MKDILYIDLDGVIFNFKKAFNQALVENPRQPYPQSSLGIFLKLGANENALYAFERLDEKFDVYFLTAPSTKPIVLY